MADTNIDKKLKSLAEMAKRGIGNERDNAERLLRRACEKYGVDFESVLNDLLIEEFEFDYGEVGISKELVMQTYAKYAMLETEETFYEYRYRKVLVLKTTKEKWNDFLVAIPEVARQYKKQRKELLKKHKKERDVFTQAFVRRHNLYPPFSIGGNKKMTRKQMEQFKMACALAGDIDEDLHVHRQITSGENK